MKVSGEAREEFAQVEAEDATGFEACSWAPRAASTVVAPSSKVYSGSMQPRSVPICLYLNW